jgi:hypothetical protein
MYKNIWKWRVGKYAMCIRHYDHIVGWKRVAGSLWKRVSPEPVS